MNRSPIRNARLGAPLGGWVVRGLIGAMLFVSSAEAQPLVEQELPSSSVRGAADDAAVLGDLTAAFPSRAAAADRLLSNPAPEARRFIQELLGPIDATSRTPPHPTVADAAMILLRQVAAMPAAPPWLLAPIMQAAEPNGQAGAQAVVSSARRLATIEAAGSIRTRESVKWLIEQSRETIMADAAVQSLIRLTGHAEFGGDLNRWALWYSQVQWVSDAEWRRELAESLAARVDALVTEHERILERLLAGSRKSYFTLESPAERSALLSEFLGDQQPELRSLGLSLAKQELANARRLDPTVSTAALRLLADPRPAVRRDAAELVTILAPSDDEGKAGTAASIAAALQSETDAEAAALLLRAASRWPDPALAPVALAWLESEHGEKSGPTMVPACELLDALRENWPQTVHQAGPRIAAAVREMNSADLARLPAPCLRLLFVLGDSADRQRVAALLTSAEPADRLAAASALAPLDAAAESVIAAAHQDSALFAAAARAITAHRATAVGFRTMARLPISVENLDLRRDLLLQLARRLSHNDLYRAASAIQDPKLRDSMLERLLTEPLASQFLTFPQRTAKPGVVAGLLLLYNTRVQLGRPSGALAAVDALTPVLDQSEPQEQDNRRTELLLWLNRLDEASRLSGSASSWIRGLRHCIGLPQARSVLLALESRFGYSISGEEAEQLAALRMAIEHGPDPARSFPPITDDQR